jgi:hypothetical protein
MLQVFQLFSKLNHTIDITIITHTELEMKMMTLKLKLLSQLAFPMDQTSQDVLLKRL